MKYKIVAGTLCVLLTFNCVFINAKAFTSARVTPHVHVTPRVTPKVHVAPKTSVPKAKSTNPKKITPKTKTPKNNSKKSTSKPSAKSGTYARKNTSKDGGTTKQNNIKQSNSWTWNPFSKNFILWYWLFGNKEKDEEDKGENIEENKPH